MNFEYNGFIAKLRKFDNDYALKVTDLIAMSGQNFTQFYKRLKQNFKYDKYIRRTNRKDTCLTLDGCIVMLESFREPNDGLIKKIKDFINENKTEELGITCDFNKMFPSNEEIIKKLETKTDDINLNAGLAVSELQSRISMIDDRLRDIENNLRQLNDKPNQSSFRDLLKECIKEIILEELQQ